MSKAKFINKILATLVLNLFCFGAFGAAQENRGVWAGAFEADDVLAAIRHQLRRIENRFELFRQPSAPER